MNDLRHRPRWPLALVLGYAVAGVAWGIARTALGPAEAALLLAARETPGCIVDARGPLELLACGLPGVAALVARLAALGDRLGGVAGARAAGLFGALALVLLVHRTARSPRWGGHGLLAAASLAALGIPLQLLATVHPRIAAALLVAAAVPLLEPARGGDDEPVAGALRAAAAGVVLALAITATPVAALFAVPLAAVVVLARRWAAALALAAAAALVLGASAALGDGAAWAALVEAVRASPPGGWSTVAPQLARVLDGLAMPLLLASFALFHRDGGWRAALAVALACPAFLVPLLSPQVEDARTAQLLAFVVLAPAAGVGVARMSETFAAGNPARQARPLFAVAVLVVAAAYGVHEMRTARRDGPDLSAAVDYLRRAGAGGRTLLVESDFGAPERVYRYHLAAATPPARVVPLARADADERREALRAANPDWVVLDAHHAARSFATAERDYLAQGFAVAASWEVPVASGSRRLELLRRASR